jgi:translocator protein
VAWAAGVAIGTSAVMDTGPWYQSLHQPDWQPPDSVSDAIWAITLALGAIAAVVASNALLADRPVRLQLLSAFLVNGGLVVLWSVLFYRCRRPDWALIEFPLLAGSVIAMMWSASRASRTAGWLLVPYLAWVGFSGLLNASFVAVN